MSRLWLPSVFIKRDKRFILMSILSLALAIGLINGTLMYLDSAVMGYFDDQLSLVDIDIAFEYDPIKSQEGTLSITELDAHIKGFYPEVADSIETEVLQIQKINNLSSIDNQMKWHLCGSSDELFTLFPLEFNLTSGTLNLTGHSAVMEDNLASSLSLSIGDPFNVSFSIIDTSGGTPVVTWYTLNYTLKATYLIETSMEDIWFWNYKIRIVTDLDELQTDLNHFPMEDIKIGDEGYVGQIFVKINRQAVNPLSVYGLISQIQTSTTLTLQEYLNEVLNVYSNISWAIDLFLDWSITLRVIFTAMGLPIIICGWLVAKHVVDIKTSRRSYEIGILKSRGATSTQIKTTLRTEAILSGILGGLLAIPFGLIVAWLISKVESFLVFNITINPRYPLGLPFWVIILSLALTGALHYISYLTSTGVVNLDVVDAATKVDKEAKAGRPLIPLGFMLIFTVPTVFILQIPASFSPPTYNIYFGISGLSTAIFYGYFIVFCFIACLAYIVSYYTPKFKAYLISHVPRLFNPVTTKLISRRSDIIAKHDVYTGMFLILILGVGVSGIVSAASAEQHTWNAAQYHVGGDLRLDLGLTNQSAANQVISKLEEFDGVARATESIKLQANLEEYGGDISVLAVHPLQFKEIAFYKYLILNPIENLIQPIDIWTALNTTKNGVFLGRNYAFTEFGSILSGDQLNIRFLRITENGTSPVYGNLTVLGFIDEVNKEFSDNIAIINIDYLQSLFSDDALVNSKIYVDLESNVNGTQVSQELENELPNTFTSINTAQSYIDEVAKTQESRIIYGFFSLNYILAILLAGAGLIMILSLRFDGRTRELAILRALGLASNQLNSYMTIDTITQVLINIVSGLILGVIFSALGVKTILGFMGAPAELQDINLPIELVYPLTYILILISTTLLATIAATYLITKKYQSMEIFRKAHLDIE